MRVGFTEKRYVIVFPPKPKFSEAPILFWHRDVGNADSFGVNTVVSFAMTYDSFEDANDASCSAYLEDDSNMYNRPYIAAVTLATQGEVISDALGVPVKEKAPRRARRRSYSPW